MEDGDFYIEKLQEKFKHEFMSKVESMSPVEIACSRNSNTEIPQFINLHESKLKLIDNLKKTIEIPQPCSFSQKILDNLSTSIDLPTDVANELTNFFNNEKKRVEEKYKIITERFNKLDCLEDVIPQLSLVVEEVSKYNLSCNDTLSRLGPSTFTSFNFNDVRNEIFTLFDQRRKCAIIKYALKSVELFPITKRREILKRFSETCLNLIITDRNTNSIPMYLQKEEQLDSELHRLAGFFGITQDIDENDSQSFMYHCEKLFSSYFRKFQINDIRRKNIDIPIPRVNQPTHYLIYNSLLAQIPEDHTISNLINSIPTIRPEQILSNIREQSSFYPTFIGQALQPHRKVNLFLTKIYTWMELRWMRLRYLWEAFVHYTNYFQYVRYFLSNPSTNIKIRKSQKFSEFIEVYDEEGPFIFSMTDKICSEIVSKLSRLVGNFLSKLEKNDQKIIDRESTVERLLTCLFDLSVAKYHLVSALFEILAHKQDDKIIEQIHKTINSVPSFDVSLFNSYEYSFKYLSQSLELQALAVRKLINMQIIHERQCSSMMTDPIPIFDRPHLIDDTHLQPITDGGVPISPFEVYENLSIIGGIFDQVANLVPEFLESIDAKSDKFYSYMEVAIWNEVINMITQMGTNGRFPYDQLPYKIPFQLSDSVASLFMSPYVNDIYTIDSMMTGMNEGRKLRFLLSVRRLLNYVWNLQDEILITCELQQSYLAQCKKFSTPDVAVNLSPFVNQRLANQKDVMQEDIIEFASNEFSPVQLDFNSLTVIKDFLFSGHLKNVDEVFRCQRNQNMILEVSIRYNDFFLDTQQIVDMFSLDNVSDNTFFVTGTEVANDIIENEAKIYNKRFAATIVFYDSQELLKSYQRVKQNRMNVMLNIRNIKVHVRNNLEQMAKSRNLQELRETYQQQMIETFSAFLYRIEIARICGCERRLLLSNSFVDTFALGPLDGQLFVNEAGRFENFFYVPTWTEVFDMVSTVEYDRQSEILKFLVPYVIYRLRIISYTRFVATLDQKLSLVFESLSNHQLLVETAIFQKLSNEFSRMPNAREIDTLSQYVKDKENLFLTIIHTSLLYCYETFFTSLKGDLSVSSQKEFIPSGQKELQYAGVIKEFIISLLDELPTNCLSSLRYLPRWESEFCYKMQDDERKHFSQQITFIEQFIDAALKPMRNGNYIDSFQMVTPMTDFAHIYNSMISLKLSYFQILEHVHYETLNSLTSITNITQEQYIKSHNYWVDGIMKECLQKITQPGDQPEKTVTPHQQYKFTKCAIDLLSDHIENLVSQQQAKNLEKLITNVMNSLNTKNKDLRDMKPVSFNVRINSVENEDKDAFIISPQSANSQFNDEMDYSTAVLVSNLSKIINDCITRIPHSKDENKEKLLVLDSKKFEEELSKFSESLQTFISASIHDEVYTWKQYNLSAMLQLKKIKESIESSFIIQHLTSENYKSEVSISISSLYFDKICELNKLDQKRREILHTMDETNNEIASSIRKEFDSLVQDISKEVEHEKSKFVMRKRKTYQCILNILQKPHSLDNDYHKSTSPTAQENENILSNVKSKNEYLIKKVKILRILRTMGKIALERSFSKKVQMAKDDRRIVNASLWSNRLTYETHGEEMEEQLKQAQKRLSEDEYNIESVKNSLEIEKSSNIQMVQWKATNCTRIVELNDQIKSIETSLGNSNVGQLLKKLSSAQDELSRLEEENNTLEDEIEEEIRKPIRQSQRVRTAISRTRIERSRILGSVSQLSQLDYNDITQKRSPTYEEYVQENEQLKAQNAQLRRNIDKLTEQISQLPQDMQYRALPPNFLSTSNVPSSRKPNFVRPVTSKTSTRSITSKSEIAKTRKQPIFI
ncbi:hypothetical protein TVAG_191230 [Trichomonas vaginalis G3]|uniref:Uncharacterized protein n=1 Tax=Trichomonas vaginalis (strain ATCC PRA-98 / G3) TaxID=412133 RepID=A2EFK6_TRIV3|nr:coiled-coil domain-containing protein 162 family [Trichomonas vaginalis G3]EAY08600.1 hypothetical protein TVAG_191230 [Trichomonas vaginalis G3]KAI5497902.1 coiled-coil domain-containing protein 162 family [Trichomonas vaginalis G3]|eukprot:XP_001320823.1 hypothetical protein [Trichomonas vaginalis G3]